MPSISSINAGYARLFSFFPSSHFHFYFYCQNEYRIHIIQIHISCFDINQLFMLYAIRRVQVQFVRFRTKSCTTTNNDDDDDDDVHCTLCTTIEQVFYSKDSVLSANNVFDCDVCHSFQLPCTFQITITSEQRMRKKVRDEK